LTTYTVDWFMTLDGFGSGPEAYWGKDGPELREQRARTYGDPDQTLVFGGNTYRLFQKFAPPENDPSHSPLDEAEGTTEVTLRSVPDHCPGVVEYQNVFAHRDSDCYR
jgi:hypothetical protein